MRRSLKLALLVLAAWAARASAQANPVAANPTQDAIYLRLGGAPGATNKYVSTMDMFFRSPQMAAMMSPDTSLPTIHFTRMLTRHINAVDGDTITYVETVDSIGVESPAMPMMAGAMGPMAEAERGRQTTMRMDTRGRVVSLSVANPTNPNDPAAGGTPPQGGGRGMRSMGGNNQRMVFVFPAQAVRPGDTWTDSVMMRGDREGDPATNFLATYRLVSIDNRQGVRTAIIAMNGTMATNGPNGPQILATGGEIQYDVPGRRVASFLLTATGTLSTPQGDVPMRMRMSQSLTP